MQQYTDKAKAALQKAAKAAKDLHQSYIGSEHILVGLVKEKSGVAARVLAENGVDEVQLISMIRELIAPEGDVALMERDGYSPRASKVLEDSHLLAEKYGSRLTGTEHILLALLREGENVGLRLLNTIGINVQKLYMDTLIAMGEDINRHKDDLNKNRNKKKGYGITQTLNQYSRDLTSLAKEGKLDPVVGRETEIMRVVQILSRRTKNNPCLIGEPGVGKTAIAEGIALKLASGDVPFRLQGKELYLLDLTALVAGTQFRGQFESRVKSLIDEVKNAGNVMLFVDEVHNLVGTGGDSEGSMNAANIFKPALSRGELQVIGATTFAEYRKHIEKDSALERRFQPVTVNEPTIEETVTLLGGIKKYYEEHHKVHVTDEIVKMCAVLSERYINDRFLPDKAIDLLDEACACASLGNASITEYEKMKMELAAQKREESELAEDSNIDYARLAELKTTIAQNEKKIDGLKKAAENVYVSMEDLSKVIELWTGIPANKIQETEFKRMAELEDNLKAKIIGQDEACELVAKAIKRSRIQLSDRRRPASFIFVGPTGVGKTELVKVLAKEMFDTVDPLDRKSVV